MSSSSPTYCDLQKKKNYFLVNSCIIFVDYKLNNIFQRHHRRNLRDDLAGWGT